MRYKTFLGNCVKYVIDKNLLSLWSHLSQTKKTLLHIDLINTNQFEDSKTSIYFYLLQKDIDVESIRLQKEEVSDIRWLSKTEINNYVNNNMVVPHKEDFKIINELLH